MVKGSPDLHLQRAKPNAKGVHCDSHGQDFKPHPNSWNKGMSVLCSPPAESDSLVITNAVRGSSTVRHRRSEEKTEACVSLSWSESQHRGQWGHWPQPALEFTSLHQQYVNDCSAMFLIQDIFPPRRWYQFKQNFCPQNGPKTGDASRKKIKFS